LLKENEMKIDMHDQYQADQAALHASVTVNGAGGVLTLHDQQLLRMRDALGWTVKAMRGTLWITQQSDSRDIVLRPGESFILDRAGTALVTTLGEAQVCLSQAHNWQPAARRPLAAASLASLAMLQPQST
jgi:hypothetical protein